MLARKHKGLYEEFDFIFADGVLLSSMLSFLLRPTNRISFDFTSIATDVFQYACESNQDVYFVGSTSECVEAAVAVFRKRFPNLIVNGYRNGFFDEHTYGLFIDEMVQRQPSILIVGMGAPLQEKLLVDLKRAGWLGLGFTCGGFLHQTAKFDGDYYPSIMNRLNLRWLYRIYDEPKLARRYVVYYPRFIVLFVWDWVRFRLAERRSR